MHLSRALSMLALPATLTAQPAWRVDPTPVTKVAATLPNGDAQFAIAAWATRLPTGEVAIAEGLDLDLRIADASGRIGRTLGRKGAGPGEFTMLAWVGRCGGDTLYAWDPRSARVSLFHPAGGYVRQFAVPAAAGAMMAACTPRGTLALHTGVAPRRDAAMNERRQTRDGRQFGIGMLETTVLVIDDSGRTRHQHAGVLFGEMLMGQLRPGGGMGGAPRPLGHVGGFTFVGDNLAIGQTDSLRLDVHSGGGARSGRFAIPPVAGRPTAADYERAIGPVTAIVPAQVRTDVEDFLRTVEPPDRFPAFSRVLGGEDGLVWLVTSRDGEPQTRLRAHRLTGEVVATLELPVALTVFEVGRDYVLGRAEDADGEQAVVLYRFVR